MKTIFDTCEPRPEVLKGRLREEIFAARLKDVIEGKADAVYQDPTTFFDNTYPTEGLKLLLDEAPGRLTGVKLDTGRQTGLHPPRGDDGLPAQPDPGDCLRRGRRRPAPGRSDPRR